MHRRVIQQSSTNTREYRRFVEFRIGCARCNVERIRPYEDQSGHANGSMETRWYPNEDIACCLAKRGKERYDWAVRTRGSVRPSSFSPHRGKRRHAHHLDVVLGSTLGVRSRFSIVLFLAKVVANPRVETKGDETGLMDPSSL